MLGVSNCMKFSVLVNENAGEVFGFRGFSRNLGLRGLVSLMKMLKDESSKKLRSNARNAEGSRGDFKLNFKCVLENSMEC